MSHYTGPKTAVIAIGGNSLIQDKNYPELKYQWDAVRQTAEHIATMIEQGWQMVVTHGNGPQVGFILRRNELAAHEVHMTPLDIIGADTQGAIGYMLQQALDNSLRVLKLNKTVITLVTQTLVEANDPAFQNPNKPIGGFLTQEQAEVFKAEGWQVVEDKARGGWRRVVASPQPKHIIEMGAIRNMIQQGYIVVAVGGGGIPVIRNSKGELRGALAVIDKDRASSLLATGIGADLFIISTDVPKVAINFNTPEQKDLDHLTLAEAKQYLAEGQFGEGSMKPKMEAVIRFIEGGGPQALITSPATLAEALAGKSGTWVTPG
jgi:carbamate kinase